MEKELIAVMLILLVYQAIKINNLKHKINRLICKYRMPKYENPPPPPKREGTYQPTVDNTTKPPYKN